jgi:hypothetical protein
MRGIRLVIGLALAVAACDAGTAERATALCTTFCRQCEAPVDSIQDECVGDCVGDFIQVIDRFPEECLVCIESNVDKCTSIEAECAQACDIIDEPPPPPPVEIVDAGMPI